MGLCPSRSDNQSPDFSGAIASAGNEPSPESLTTPTSTSTLNNSILFYNMCVQEINNFKFELKQPGFEIFEPTPEDPAIFRFHVNKDISVNGVITKLKQHFTDVNFEYLVAERIIQASFPPRS